MVVVPVFLLSGGYRVMVTIDLTENNAYIGSGLLPHGLVYDIQEVHWNIAPSNVTINNNHITSHGSYTSAAVTHTVTNLKLDNVRITNNNSTGLLAFSAVGVSNNSKSVFHNNSSVDGGGLDQRFLPLF